jgi:hypothetical protein
MTRILGQIRAWAYQILGRDSVVLFRPASQQGVWGPSSRSVSSNGTVAGSDPPLFESLSQRQNKIPYKVGYFIFGGEIGIRTLDTVARIAVFETAAFDHSAISPNIFTPLNNHSYDFFRTVTETPFLTDVSPAGFCTF